MKRETDLEMVRRHVQEGEVHVKRQEEIIAELKLRGAPTEVAVTLLKQFEDVLRQHRAHLKRLQTASGFTPTGAKE